MAIALDEHENLYIAGMYGQRVHKVYANGNTIQTIVTDYLYIAGMDYHNGRLYMSERNVVDSEYRILSVKVDGTDMQTLAGTGFPGYSGDGGPATQATMRQPCGLWVANNGTVYFSDSGNRAIRKIDGSTGVITTVKSGLGRVEYLAGTSQGDLVYTTNDTCSVYQMAGPF